MQASPLSPLLSALLHCSLLLHLSCLMSTSTTSAHPSASSELSLSPGSSQPQKHESSVQRSISDPTSLMRTSSSPPLPNKSWHQSYSSFQTSTQSQCPRVHYHPWCEECQTLTIWEQPLLTKRTCKKQIPTFGDLKTVVRERSHYRSPFANQSTSQTALQKVCSTWRDEQFAKAVAKRSAKMAAREAVRRSAHQQRAVRGATPP